MKRSLTSLQGIDEVRPSTARIWWRGARGLFGFLFLTGTAVATAHGATFTVNSAGDSADAIPGNGICATTGFPAVCTLRAAIQEANALAGVDTIQFSLGTGTPVIALAAPLPHLTQPIIVNGNSGGADRIEVRGDGLSRGSAGLVLTGGSSTVRFVVVNGFPGHGIVLRTAGGNTLDSCRVGTNAAGTVARRNDGIGIVIDGSPNNQVRESLVSGNAEGGILLLGASAGNLFYENRIGTNLAGSSAIANGGVGIESRSPQTRVRRNLISGNASHGVLLGEAAVESQVEMANYIGSNADGTLAIANGGDGVVVQSKDCHIGFLGDPLESEWSAGNLISGNTGAGIRISGAGGNRIDGNYVGVGYVGQTVGAKSLANLAGGIVVTDSPNNLIGGTEVDPILRTKNGRG